MLPPEQGGMFPPEQHPSGTVTLDDLKRGLNTIIDNTKQMGLDGLADEEQVQWHIAAMTATGFDTAELRGLLAWAIVRLSHAVTFNHGT